MSRRVPAGRHPSHKGWPRRKILATVEIHDLNGDVVRNEERMLPNLWIGGRLQLDDDWITFDPRRSDEAMTKGNCVVCGARVTGLGIFGRYFKPPLPIANRYSDWTERRSDGPWGHPRCMHLARHTCPHFERGLKTYSRYYDRTTVAYAWAGDATVGYDVGMGDYRVPEDAIAITSAELAALAKEAPLGLPLKGGH